MLNSLDIALLFDNRTVDGAGNVITKGRSRKGIHALLGNGVTAATMPTWDSARGLYTFDGGDYLEFLYASDITGTLRLIGSVEETYMFYMTPVVVNSLTNTFISNNLGVNPRFIIRIGATNAFETYMYASDGSLENTATAAGSMLAYNGKNTYFAVVRYTGFSQLYINGTLYQSWSLTTKDASSTNSVYVGIDPGAGNNWRAGTGCSFFGYARRAFTQTQLQAIQKYLRGVI